LTQKTDLDTVFAFASRYAKAWQDEHAEFVPFGVTLDSNRVCELLFADVESTEQRPLREVLTEGLRDRARAGNCLAVGLCVDVRITLKEEGLTDAIFVYVEHVEGLALQVVTPYKRLGEGLRYGVVRASKGEPRTFFGGTVQ
jgi:hypothetical protein